MAFENFHEDFAEPHEWAAVYRACGLQVIPAHNHKSEKNYKRPLLSTWTEFQQEIAPQAVFDTWYGRSGQYRTTNNMGLITGAASGGVFCVDLDVKDGSRAMEWWGALVNSHSHGQEPDTPAQKTGGGGRQILFRAPAGYIPPTFKTSIGIDIRGQGGFMMCPPSQHLSGKDYAWEAGRGPHEVSVEEAPDWLIEAIEDLREQFGGTPTGQRERVEAANQKSAFGKDLDGREDKIQRWVWARVVDLRRECPAKPIQSVQDAELASLWDAYLLDTGSRLAPRDGMSVADLLEAEGRGLSEMRRKWRYAMNKWDGKVKEAAEVEKAPAPFVEAVVSNGEVVPVVTDEAPKPGGHTLFDPWERYVVPAFPLETLSPVMRRFVDYLSTSTGGDPSACAMGALAACSGALDQGFSLKMKRTGNWYAKPRLWVMMVGSPSSKKTPIISTCVKPIRDWEGIGVRQYQKDVARFKEDKEGGAKDGREPERPTRYLINGCTAEKLGDILSRQDRGAIVEQDEIAGWIGSMEKYGGKGSSADRGFWLTAFNGGPYTVDRIGRGETFIQNLCVAFVGGVQPEKLAELGNLVSDGLLQRFLPVMMRQGEYPQEVEDDKPWTDYETTIKELLLCKPSTLFMDESARAASEEFQRFLHDLERMEGLGKGFCGFAGKLGGLHGSLSLVMHMIEDPGNMALEPVSERTVRAAERIITEFCIPHALELYRSTGDGADWDYLRSLASFVLTSNKDRFTVSDFTSGVHSMRGMGVWDVAQKLSPLVAGGWLVEDETSKTARAWTIVPGLREALSERRKEEAERKEEVVQKLGRLKKGKVTE